MTHRIVLVAVVLSAAVFSSTAAAAPKASMSIFVLVGQSNMAGYGFPVPVEKPNPRLFDLTQGIKPAMDPLGFAAGVGPGRYFGLYLAKRGMRVGLVNCAAGGTFISQWQPDTRLYAICIAEVQAALAYGHVAGIVFMQGESDEETAELAGVWGSQFGLFVAGIRSSLAAPSLPVVFGRVLDFTDCAACGLPFGAMVRDQQAAVRIPKVVMVNADDIPHNGEHFTVPGYNVLGNRMAQAWLNLRRG